MPLKTYTVHDYATGKAVAEIYMRKPQFQRYLYSSDSHGVVTREQLLSFGCEMVWSETSDDYKSFYLMEQ